MLRRWMKILPVFVVEWIARRYCERISQVKNVAHGPPGVCFYDEPEDPDHA